MTEEFCLFVDEGITVSLRFHWFLLLTVIPGI